jgi:hypothetical protein
MPPPQTPPFGTHTVPTRAARFEPLASAQAITHTRLRIHLTLNQALP